MRPLPSTTTVPRPGTLAVLNVSDGAAVVGVALAAAAVVEGDDEADLLPDDPQAANTTGATTAKATAAGHRRPRESES
ncbi:MAG: hypothetical protein JO148_01510 [Acidimicrobiia bacterium]|nr:hypothetical protein [Acidimicrobiia bacterium]